MMRRKQLTELLDEKSERVLVLETKLESLQQQLDGYKEREQSIVASLTSAQSAAARQMEEAEQRGKALLDRAEINARQTLADARRQAETALANAKRGAETTLAEAKAKAEALLADAENRRLAIIAGAESDIAASQADAKRFNEQLAACAAAAQQAANEFAAFCAGRQVEAISPLPETEQQQAHTVSAEELTDGADNPAIVMQNIYKLQNRDVPADGEAASEPTQAQDIPDAEPDQEGEELPDYAPRPEDAYAREPYVPQSDSVGEPYVPEGDWQPDDKETAAPTVKQLLPDEDEVSQSLDALLDEIIRAGE